MDLPIVDAHAREISAPPERAWSALVATLPRAFAGRAAERFARVVGCREVRASGAFPAAGATLVGFRVARALAPRELALEGAHRFSEYALTFRVEEIPRGSRVVAETRAAFPGRRGAAYRALVIGTRGHVVVVRRLLRAVARRAAERPS